GPANAPLDRVARILSGGRASYDEDGRLARAGSVDESLLEALLREDEFLRRPPPKSTGLETSGDEFVERAARRHGRIDHDLMATLVEFTARTIGLGLRDHVAAGRAPLGEVIAAGGGARNPVLLERIRAAVAPAHVHESDEYGVPAQAREAMA